MGFPSQGVVRWFSKTTPPCCTAMSRARAVYFRVCCGGHPARDSHAHGNCTTSPSACYSRGGGEPCGGGRQCHGFTGRASRPGSLAPASRAGHGLHAHLMPTCIVLTVVPVVPRLPGILDTCDGTPVESGLFAQGDHDGPTAHRTPHLEYRPQWSRMAAH